MKRLVMIVVPLLLSIGTTRAACIDPGAVASTRAAADPQCPCATGGGHERYVHCVARIANETASDPGQR